MRRSMTLAVLSLIGFCFASSSLTMAQVEAPRIGVREPIARTPGTIRVATYNVENLFDAKDDPALSGRYEDKEMTKPAAHQQAVADAIKRIDADVIALQEIESFDALIEFRDTYLKGLGYEHVISIDAGDERGIEQSVISRFPLKDPKVWVHEPLEGEHPEKVGRFDNEWFGKKLTFHRSPLRVTVEVPAEKTGGDKAYELTLFVVHHKSARNFNYWRKAEAMKTVEFVAEMMKENSQANILVLGDFNAEENEEAFDVYRSAGLIPTYNNNLPFGDPGALTHASERIIDVIMSNEAVRKELVPGSLFALYTAQLRKEEDWRTAPKPAGYASDHLPVVVDVKPVDVE